MLRMPCTSCTMTPTPVTTTPAIYRKISGYGQTCTLWSDPTPSIMRPELLGGSSSDVPYIEAVVFTAKLADNSTHHLQVDYSPLTYQNSPTEDTEASDNTIRYVGFPVAVLDAKMYQLKH
ncbi:MAG: hypothetical protein R2778_12730 [Saprospiraceae bacterium]